MAKREDNLKKINEELELLSDEELENVAGGAYLSYSPPGFDNRKYPPRMQSENPNPFETNPH